MSDPVVPVEITREYYQMWQMAGRLAVREYKAQIGNIVISGDDSRDEFINERLKYHMANMMRILEIRFGNNEYEISGQCAEL